MMKRPAALAVLALVALCFIAIFFRYAPMASQAGDPWVRVWDRFQGRAGSSLS
jgi:hypothetical protein